MSNVDVNGETIQPYIASSEYVIFTLTGASNWRNAIREGFQTWYIANTSLQDDGIPNNEDATLLLINEPPSSDAVNSFDDSFYDLTFSASGVFSYYATSSGEDPNVIPATGFTESIAQGYFPPVPTYPTESFFKGWDSASYFQTTETGGVVRVSTGDGFNTDTFRNFNTGSREFDGDSTNSRSEVPWFMDAKNDTYHALSASSTVSLTPSVTQLGYYSGDITASAVPIGPAFNLYSPPATITISPSFTVTGGTPGPISTSCPSGVNQQIFPGASESDRTIQMQVDVNGNPSSQWIWYVLFDIGNGFEVSPETPSWLPNQTLNISPNPDRLPSGGIGTGNATIQVQFTQTTAATPPNQDSYRTVRIVVENYVDQNEVFYCGDYTQFGDFSGTTVPGNTEL